MSKTVSIIQSSYIPWKGYFDIIKNSDIFVIFDSVQFTKRDWRNRNQIKTANGLTWLTIPVNVKGKFFQSIWDTEITSGDWADNHWKSIYYAYKKAPYFEVYADKIEALYKGSTDKELSSVNLKFLREICSMLEIETEFVCDRDLKLPETDSPTERLATICEALEATQYISGPSAKAYMEEDSFKKRGISISYFDYQGYPEYQQLYPPFTHRISILDLLFSTGKNAKDYLIRSV